LQRRGGPLNSTRSCFGQNDNIGPGLAGTRDDFRQAFAPAIERRAFFPLIAVTVIDRRYFILGVV
jgi:hypothetical protein